MIEFENLIASLMQSCYHVVTISYTQPSRNLITSLVQSYSNFVTILLQPYYSLLAIFLRSFYIGWHGQSTALIR